MPLRYPALLDDGTARAVAPALAGLLKTDPALVHDALDASLRTLAAHAERMARGPFGTASLHRLVLASSFDAAADPAGTDGEGGTTACGRPLAKAADWALRVFGVEHVARLASALARVLPLDSVPAVRIPDVAAAMLLAAWREEIRQDALDPVGLAAVLVLSMPMRSASLLTLRIATAAGLPLAPAPFEGP